MTLKNILPNLDINLELEIRSGLSSIHKLDSKDEEYKKLLDDNSHLQGLTYIVYPNDNTNRSVVLLDKNGKKLDESKSYMSKLGYIPLGFEIEYPPVQSKILDMYKDLEVKL